MLELESAELLASECRSLGRRLLRVLLSESAKVELKGAD